MTWFGVNLNTQCSTLRFGKCPFDENTHILEEGNSYWIAGCDRDSVFLVAG